VLAQQIVEESSWTLCATIPAEELIADVPNYYAGQSEVQIAEVVESWTCLAVGS
jgi:hypothetical protein